MNIFLEINAFDNGKSVFEPNICYIWSDNHIAHLKIKMY
jgi:hypothetical protein